jgi:signal transduction histidine kinase
MRKPFLFSIKLVQTIAMCSNPQILFFILINTVKDKATVGGNYIFCFHRDQSGSFWCGNGGLNLFDHTENRFQPFHSALYKTDSLGIKYVGDIYEDDQGVFWLTSFDKGLIKFDRRNNSLKIYTMNDGLPSNTTWCTLEDERGNLWISTEKGVSKFNPETEKFENFDTDDGLQANQFSSGGHLKGESGRLYMSGLNGLNIFYPDSIKPNPHIPDIVITEFSIFNQSILPGNHPGLKESIVSAGTIQLSYRDYVFGFKFAALEYTIPQRNLYAYKMDGFESNWIYTDVHNRYATYTNLDPGEYVFRVKGSNNNGIWNEEGRSIRIVISPPWWKTKIAYGFYLGFIILVLFGLRHYDLRRQRLKHMLDLEHEHAEKLEEIDAMKSRFFANISHEFRTPITLILAPVTQMITGDFKGSVMEGYSVIRSNARKLLRLVNQLLALSKLESGQLKLQVSKADIVTFIDRIFNTFLSLAEHRDIDFRFNDELKSLKMYFDPEKIETILNNLLSNAFKHTPPGGRIIVTLTSPLLASPLGEDGNTVGIMISVTNTGPGIPIEEKERVFERFYQGRTAAAIDGAGIGLALVKDLTELHHGHVSLESIPDGETIFTVELPSNDEAYQNNEIIEATHDIGKTGEADSRAEDKNADDRIESGIHGADDNKPIVLLIEDNREMRRFIRQNLITEFDILEANSVIRF